MHRRRRTSRVGRGRHLGPAGGRKDDPPYRALRLLVAAHERLSEPGDAKLRGRLAAGDPHGDVRLVWHANQSLRNLYHFDCPQLAERYATELVADLRDPDCPPELRRLGRTLTRSHSPIANWHHARISNGPTEAVNNLIERVKRAAFGIRRFAHHRVRAHLYAGKPDWTLLNGLTPAESEAPLMPGDPRNRVLVHGRVSSVAV